jgi:hypothetical protein
LRQQTSVAAQQKVSVPQQPPASQALAVHASAHAPFVQIWPLAQTVPHPPQFAESLFGSEQFPLQQF